MDSYHKLQHRTLVDDMLAELDGGELAEKINTLTGGCMRAEDALKLAGMVALAALHAPDTEVLVAGIGARADGMTLRIYCQANLAEKSLTIQKEVADVPVPN